MSNRKNLLKILSDAIEAESGEVVDLAAWDFDQLVRVLKNPNELLGLMYFARSYSGVSEQGARSQDATPSSALGCARRAVLGPIEVQDQINAAHVEALREVSAWERGRTQQRHLREAVQWFNGIRVHPGNMRTPEVINTRLSFAAQWPEVESYMRITGADLAMPPGRPAFEAYLDASEDVARDASTYSIAADPIAHSGAADMIDAMRFALDAIHEAGRLCPATLNLAPGAVVTCERCRAILAPHTRGEIYAPHALDRTCERCAISYPRFRDGLEVVHTC